MPPKKKGRASSTTASTEAVERPESAAGPSIPPVPTAHNPPPVDLASPWTDDQISSLFKAIIRYKPAGMHRHFRMIAISDHLRKHGIDPDKHTHTRIPGIWAKLSEYYNMSLIDDRENAFDSFDDNTAVTPYCDFDLPWNDYGDLILERAKASQSDPPSSPPRFHSSHPSPAPSKKRKRSDNVAKTRASTVDDSEGGGEEDDDGESVAPSPAKKTTRSTRSAKRAVSKTKAESTDADEEEAEEQDGEDSSDDDEGEDDDSEEEAGTPASKSARGGSARGRGRGASRGRGRGRARGRGV